MRRFALYSDVHGNSVALDAVLRDIDESDLAERYCLGDLVGYGPDPAGVIERVRTEGRPVLRGNYDQGVGDRSGSCGCYYATDQERSDGAASYAFTARAVGDDDAAWLTRLPSEIRFEEAGVRVVLTHGSPRRINEYLLLERAERQLARLAQDAEADLVCCGHVHIPYHRSFAAEPGDPDGSVVHYVNAGSVGKPKDGDPRACWVELLIGAPDEVGREAPDDAHAARAGAGDTWVGVVVHRVAYDVESVAFAIAAAGLPATLADTLRTG